MIEIHLVNLTGLTIQQSKELFYRIDAINKITPVKVIIGGNAASISSMFPICDAPPPAYKGQSGS